MDLHVLELFLRVAEVGSINKAAANLDMSQPTLSRHIAALEHEMRCPLFTRTQGGVALTDAGRLLVDRARPLLRQFTILKEQISERAAGHLAVGTPPAWQHLFTAPFVESMAGEQPGIALRIYEGLSNVLKDYMHAGLLDIAIVPFEESAPTGYAHIALVREPVVLVGGPDADLRSDTPVNTAWLKGRKMVLPSRPNVLRVQIEHSMERHGLRLTVEAETDALNLNLDLARCGVGLTVVPASSLCGPGVPERIAWAPLKGQYVTWSLCENMARGHSHALREGRKRVSRILSRALDSKVWAGAEPVAAGVKWLRESAGGESSLLCRRRPRRCDRQQQVESAVD